MLIPLSEFALRNRMGYNRALRRAIRGDVPGIQRLSGRWYVEVAPSTAGGAAPPEVGGLRRLAADIELHPFGMGQRRSV